MKKLTEKVTVLPYIWRSINSHVLRDTEAIKAFKEAISANGETPNPTCGDLGDNNDTIFHGHSISPHLPERLSDMIDQGQTFVQKNSGGCGIGDGLFSYLHSGHSNDEHPFTTFQTSEALKEFLGFFTNPTGRNQVIYRTDHRAKVKPLTSMPVGVITEDYSTPINLEVALAKLTDSKKLLIVNHDAAATYLEQVFEGLNAVSLGLIQLAEVMDINPMQTHQGIITQLSDILAEQADSPIVNVIRRDNLELLRQTTETVVIAATIADKLNEAPLKNDFLTMHKAICGSDMYAAPELDIDFNETSFKAVYGKT